MTSPLLTTSAEAELAHWRDGQAATLHMRVGRLFDEWRRRSRNGEPPAPWMLSERLTVDELSDSLAALCRALAEAIESEHAGRLQAAAEMVSRQRARDDAVLARAAAAARSKARGNR